MNVFFAISLSILLIISIILLIRKRKRQKITGWKTALTPILLYLGVFIILLDFFFEWNGLFTTWISITCFIAAAYCTKYVPRT